MSAKNDTSLQLNHESQVDLVFLSLKIIGAVTFSIGVPTNMAILCLVTRNRKLRIPTNLFICSLVVADLLVLFWMLLWILSKDMLRSVAIVINYIIPSIDISVGVASIINVACVSADRAIAVMYPFKHEIIMTKKRSLFVIVTIWFYSVVLFAAALSRMRVNLAIYNKIILYTGFLSYFTAFFIIALSYTIILVIIKEKMKVMTTLERVVSSAVTSANLTEEATAQEKRRLRRKLLRELKLTSNILLIVVPFTVGWTFFIGTHIYEHLHNRTIQSEEHNIAMITVPWFLSGLNPVVYLLFNRSLRCALTLSVKRCLCTSNSFDRTSYLSSLSSRAFSIFRRVSEEGSASLFAFSRLFQRKRSSNTTIPESVNAICGSPTNIQESVETLN